MAESTELEPRELDVLVAEKVMEWEYKTYWLGWFPPNGDFAYLDQIPPFSTDMAAAWQVVEKLQELGWHLILTHPTLTRWHVKLETGTGQCEVAAHESPARAICLAALRAVTGEDDGD